MASGPRYLHSCDSTKLFALCWVALNLPEVFGVCSKGSVELCLVLQAWTGNKGSSWPGLWWLKLLRKDFSPSSRSFPILMKAFRK